jgi:hypothetical protein
MPLPLEEGKDLVNKAMPLHVPNLERLLPAAVQRALDRRTAYRACAAAHRVEYTENHHEIQVWHFAIMFIEYTAGLILQKAEDNHCYMHRPCAETKKLHLDMARDFKKAIEEVLRDVQTEIDRVQAIP